VSDGFSFSGSLPGRGFPEDWFFAPAGNWVQFKK
jgi:hypothetical protein